ncbi:MAG: hypothetical protein LC104_18065 [Bacteroidales bacterium]|nr:hypothetical protein [Bacteroidales bacterium]
MLGLSKSGGLLSAVALTLLAVPPAWGQKKPSPVDKAVVKLQAACTPAEAKPGQTVTLQVQVHLANGFYTYPLLQNDKAAEEMVNKLTILGGNHLIPVSSPVAASPVKSKPEPLLGIRDMRYLTGVVVYEQKFVVSPKAAPGNQTFVPELRLSVCSDNNCYPPKTVKPEATLKILDGPAMAIEPAFRAIVEKSLGGL